MIAASKTSSFVPGGEDVIQMESSRPESGNFVLRSEANAKALLSVGFQEVCEDFVGACTLIVGF